MKHHKNYWKIKAAFLDVQNAELKAKLAVAKAGAALTALLAADGFNPDGEFTLEDADESITPRPMPEAPGKVAPPE